MSMKISYKKIHLFLSIFIMLWINSGNFDYIVNKIPAVIKVGLTLTWFIISNYLHKDFLVRYIKKSWVMLIFVLAVIISKIVWANEALYFKQFFMSYAYCLILLAMYIYYFYYGTKQYIKIMLLIFFADIAIVIIHTYFELLTNPIVARAISTSVEFQEKLLGGKKLVGIGGYGLCYQIIFLPIIIEYMFYRKKYNFLKYGIYMFGAIFLFKAQITMALLLYIFSVAIMSFILDTKKRKDYIFKIILLILTIYICFYYQEILLSVAQLASNDLRTRILELIEFDGIKNATDGDIGARVRLYTMSLLAFVENPIIGILGKSGYGSHSTFLDLLGGFGLVGILGIVGLLSPMLAMKKLVKKDTNLKRMSIIAIVIFSILSCLNVSTSSEILSMVLFILPIVFKYFYFRKEGRTRKRYKRIIYSC